MSHLSTACAQVSIPGRPCWGSNNSCVAGMPVATAWISGRNTRHATPRNFSTKAQVLAQLHDDVKLEVLLPWDHAKREPFAKSSHRDVARRQEPAFNSQSDIFKPAVLPPLPGQSPTHSRSAVTQNTPIQTEPAFMPRGSVPSEVPPAAVDRSDDFFAKKQSKEVDLEDKAEREALEQTMMPHYVLISAEKDVLENALTVARNETHEKVAVVHIEGKGRARCTIPDTISHGNALASFTCNTIKSAIGCRRIHIDQWRVLLESPLKSWYDPIISRFPAAIVHVRVSGFTKVKEVLAHGQQAAEKIGEVLNGFFLQILAIVQMYGGDVVKLTADSLVVIWAAEDPAPEQAQSRELANDAQNAGVFRRLSCVDDDTSSSDADGLGLYTSAESCSSSENCEANSVKTAARFCLHVQREKHKLCQMAMKSCDIDLHIAVGFGDVDLLQLGGLLGRWEYCLSGEVLEDVATALRFSEKGETVFSPEARQDAGEAFMFEPLTSGPSGYARLCGSKDEEDPDEAEKFPQWWLPEPRENIDLRLVKRFVPCAVALRIACAPESPGAASEAVTQLEEMRRISIVFLSIPALSTHGDAMRASCLSDGREAQLVLRLMQRSVFALEGQINKLIVDDQGIHFIIVFGLPPLVHFKDDPIRAVLCGMRLCDLLKDEGLRGKVGIATGQCWCGVVGSVWRREYVVLGKTVDLATTLMGRAGENKVLVDAPTYRVAMQVLEFEQQPGFQSEDSMAATSSFLFLRPRKGLAHHRKQALSCLSLWPEWPARIKLLRALEANSRTSGVMVIHGPVGAGKTELAEAVRSWARERGWTMLAGQNIDPSGTFALQRLALQEAFGELVHKASKDPFWRSRGFELLISSLGGKIGEHENIDMTQLGLQAQKLGPPAHTELYWMLIAMLRHSIGQDEIAEMEPWAPLLSLVVMQLAFGPRMVSAMVERDEQHARNNRFAELCTGVLDAFSRYGTTTGGTVLLVHVRRCNAFRVHHDPQQTSVIRAISELCMRRRANCPSDGEPRPLLLCVVSREAGDESLRRRAAECDGVVESDNLSLSHTRSFFDHLTTSDGEMDFANEVGPKASCVHSLQGFVGVDYDQSERKRRELLAQYLHDMTGGNPKTIASMFAALQSAKVIFKLADGSLGTSPVCEDLETLRGRIKLPEALKGMAFSFFERLDPMEQLVLKTLAACEHEIVEVREISAALPSMQQKDIKRVCDSLAQPHTLALQRVPPEEIPRNRCTNRPSMTLDPAWYRFYSGLLRYAVSTLVLEVQRTEVRRSSCVLDLEDIKQLPLQVVEEDTAKRPSSSSVLSTPKLCPLTNTLSLTLPSLCLTEAADTSGERGQG